jgi:hypothetical protein
MTIRLRAPVLAAKLRDLRIKAKSSKVTRPILTRIGLRARVYLTRNFFERGTLFGGPPWARVSWVTALLRKGGKFGAQSGRAASGTDNVEATFRAIFARADAAKPLMDTLDMLRSFQGNGAGAVLTIDGLRVRVGSNLPRADLNDKGGTSRFDLTGEVVAQVARAIPPTFRGKPPRESKASARHNPAFYAVLGALKKRDGKRLPVPQRKIIPDQLTKDQTRELEEIVTESYRDVEIRA